MAEIDQKEYLKRYLSSDSKKDKTKKRKKKANIIKDRVKIIDDDLDISTARNITENDLDEFLTAEDAPQVVGVIDDRPLALRLDDYRKSDKWKLVGSDDEDSKAKLMESLHDLSPARSKGPVRNKISMNMNKKRGKSVDSDVSPVRKNGRDDDISPPRRSRKDSDSDLDVPRARQKRCSDSDVSPPRKQNRTKSPDSDLSPARYNSKKDNCKSPTRKKSRWESNRDVSPPRRNDAHRNKDDKHDRNSRHRHNTPKSKDRPSDTKRRDTSKEPTDGPSNKMKKTLDGKSAGLQNASELKIETAAFKKREDDLFKNMSEEVSGKNAAPIMRDRKTGKKRDLEQEAEEEREKQKKINEQKEKYDAWGRGLKQVQDYNEKLKQDLHEMSKPLARYADDEDLEKFLKDQEREGDPMLEYLRKKKKKKEKKSGKPTKPVYEGEFMPNRYGIPPGHRWDGVDRSNGYEKQWFAKQNSKKAVEEEVYKWSTEDM